MCERQKYSFFQNDDRGDVAFMVNVEINKYIILKATAKLLISGSFHRSSRQIQDKRLHGLLFKYRNLSVVNSNFISLICLLKKSSFIARRLKFKPFDS